MVFSSLLFVFLFLPLNLLFYVFAKDIRTKNRVMLIFSLVFYAWGEPVYLLLLLGMTLADWLLARYIGKQAPKSGAAKFGVFAACAVNLGLLGVFKYGTFFMENTHALFGFPKEVIQIALPIGISFYTFQLLSYVVDVYRCEVPAQRRFATLLLYVSLFHQCIAGPIVRYQDVENELMHRSVNFRELARGITRFTIGLGKKALLANACGRLADSFIMSDATAAGADAMSILVNRPALALWIGMLAYMLQIYLDFSAYSDMAIGMGLMIGFHYKENFDYPYMSRSVTEFWRRWHISLSSFFRDYVYIPLGGSRCSKARNVWNLLVVWLLTGFWHGASWNFVLWGLYFFVFLLIERFGLLDCLKRGPSILSRFYLLLVVFFGWVLFKFRNLSLVGATLAGMFGLNGNGFTNFEVTTVLKSNVFILLVAIVACTPLVKKIGAKLAAGSLGGVGTAVYKGAVVVVPVAMLLLSTMALVGDSYNPFLYFQF